MIVKNISGGTLTLGFGSKTFTLADDASVTVEEDHNTIVKAAEHVAKGRIEIVQGPAGNDLGSAAMTPGHLLINFKAVGNDADYITITVPGATPQIFEMDAVPTASIAGATAVDIGANANASADNMKAALAANTVLTNAGLIASEVVDNGTGISWIVVRAVGKTDIADVSISTSASARIAVSSVAANTHETASVQTIHVPAVGGTTLVLPVGLTTILSTSVVALTAGGAVLAYDGTVTATGGALLFDDDGATDLAADSQLIVTITGK